MAASDDLLEQWKSERRVTAAPNAIVDSQAMSESDKLLKSWTDNRDMRFKMSVDSAVLANPDIAARNQKIARDLSLPIETVEKNSENLEGFIRSRRIEMSQAAQRDPVLMQQFTNPDFAKIAHDDWDTLSRTEKTLRWFKEIPDDIVKGYKSGQLTPEIGLLGQQAQSGSNDKAMWDRIKLLKEEEKKLKGTGGFFEEASKVVGQMSITLPKALEFGAATGLTYGGATLIAGQLGPQAALPEELVTVPTAAIGGFFAGMTAKMAEQSYRIEAGHSYLDMIDAGVDKNTAQYASAGVGLVNAGLEVVGLKYVAAPFKQALIRETTQQIAVSMTKPTTRMAVEEFAKNYGKAWTAEVSTELLQEVSAVAGEEIAKYYSDGSFEQKLSTSEGRAEIAERFASVFESTAKAMTLLAIPGASIKFRGDLKSAKEAERQTLFFTELEKNAVDSKLRERAPDAYYDLIAQQAKQGNVENLYVDAAQFAQGMRVANVTIEDINKTMPDVAKQIASAQATGGDVIIKTADYATHLAGTDFGKTLVPDLRANQDAMSANDLKEFNKQRQEFIKQAADAAMEKQAGNEDFIKSAREVESTMFNELKMTGRYADPVARLQAQFVRDFAVTQAANQNMLPMEFFNKEMNYKVQADGEAVFTQRDVTTPEFKQFFANSKVTNDQGVPVRVFTGTSKDKDFTSFNVPKNGVWFTTDAAGASQYAVENDSMGYSYEGRNLVPKNTSSRVIPAYLKIEKPYVMTDEVFQERLQKENYKRAQAQFFDELRAQGYDGVDMGDGVWVVIGNPSQIKSAFNDKPTASTNMLKQGLNTPADEINQEEDAASDDSADVISQANIPDAVDDAAALDSVMKIARGQEWNKGRDLKMAMQDAVQQQAAAAGVDVSAPSAQTNEYLVRLGVRDALFALSQNANAIGWYDEKTRQALGVMSLIHPEIATNENARFAFVWALAVTSNGMKVDKNFELAEQAYEYYKQNKVMPTNIQAGQAQGAINKSLGLFNDLVNAWGIDNLRQFMQTRFTVGEISAISKDLKPGGEHADTQVKGAAIIGPKIGNGFFSNLYGDFSSLTMDRWLIRTWGRWTGTLIKVQPNHIATATARLSDAVSKTSTEEKTRLSSIVGVDIATTPVDKLAEAVQKASMDPELRNEFNKTLEGEELRKSGNGLAKYLDGQKEAPAGPHERTYIRSIFSDVLAQLQTLPQYKDLNMADLQAVLWYAEKRLYETAKEDIAVDEESTDGYSDEEAPDYANAAAAVARAKGVSERRIANTLKKESNDERSRRSRLQDGAEAGISTGQQAEAGGFTEREKRIFAGAAATITARSNRSGSQKQQWSYTAASSRDSGGAGLLKARKKKTLGVTYTDEWKAGRSLGNIYRANGISTPTFLELEKGNLENAQRFADAIQASKDSKPTQGAAVYVYPADDTQRDGYVEMGYKNMRLFLSDDGLSGVAIKPDGDIVSVFSQGGAGRSVMEVAVAAGGKKLDAFETILPEFYAAHGFVATSRVPWDDTQAPAGWNKQGFSEFNNGEPDVVFMALDNSYQGWHKKTDGKKETSYDKAAAEQSRAVKRIQRRENENNRPAVYNQLGAGTGGIQSIRAGDLDVQSQYGESRPNSSSVIGIHYSGSARSSLAGNLYGTGLKGAESARLQGADPRLQNRIHFYVDTGSGVIPESGVGGNVHGVILNNLYDINADPLGLRAAASNQMDDKGVWFNAVESAILDAGFDGVFVPMAQSNQGVAVLLGPQHTSVPVDQFGTHAAPSAAPLEAQSQRMSFSLLGSEIKQFSEQEQAIKAAAPSAELVKGSIRFDSADQDAVAKFFPGAAQAQMLRQQNRGGFDPSRLTTILGEKADLSTFLHETAHFFLTVYENMASQATATEQVKADFQMILDWFGVKDIDAWNALSIDEKRKYHESWAYNYEIYLFEGKAPSVKMQNMFDRFSAWMRRIYKSIRDELNVIYKEENGVDLPILTGEVRGVMDRMLATEDQIKQAQQVRGMMPIYQSQEQSGMNDDEWASYQNMTKEADDKATGELTEATLRQMKWLSNARSRVLKEIQKQAADIRKKVKEEVAKDVSELPVYKAMKWLKSGETTDQDGVEVKAEAGYKLSLDAVKQMYPEDKTGLYAPPDYKKLGYGQYGMMAAEGLHPDIVASMFGYPSGDIMIRELLAANKFNEEVEIRTDQRMLEEYGELSDPDSVNIAVERAVHNEARARFVAVELRHMAKATQPVRIMLEAAKQAAKSLIAGRQLKDIKPREFTLAESRAAREAEKLMKAGKSNDATVAKKNQLLNNQLASEALSANTEVAKFLDVVKKVFAPDSRLADRRDMNYVSAARAILAQFGLGNTELGVDGYLANIKNYDPEFYAEIEALLTAGKIPPMPFDNMTFDQFRDVRDQVDALWHLSKRSRQVEIDGKLMDRKEIVAELNQQISTMDDGKDRAGYTKAITDADKRSMMLMGARASMRRVESWVDAMDGGKKDGPFRKYIWNPVSEAVAQFRLVKIDYMEKYLKLIKGVEKDLTGNAITAPEINYTFKNKAELLHAILHTGNESNKRKLLLGRMWVSENENGVMDTSNWDQFMKRMYAEGVITKKEMDFVQSVWDLLEEMKPAAQKVHREMYGFYFSEITADTFETPFGMYRGGYVPAVTDPWIVTDAAMRNEQETQSQDNSYMFPTTGRGFTKGRVEYNKPLMLDLGYFPSHIDKVLRFTYIEPKIKDAAKIVKNDKTFAAAMDKIDPTVRGDMLVPWLQRTATQMIQTPMKGRGGQLAHKFFSEIRSRTGAQLMVANITNALQQITGLSIAALKVKPQYLRQALWSYVRAPSETAERVAELSDYMRTRMSNQQFEISKTIDELLLNPSKYEKLRDFAGKHGYFMQQGMQNMVDTMVWTGAFNQSAASGDSVKQSIRLADSAVRLTQGSFAPEDVSRFETGNAFVRAFTMFYSYFNMQANLLGTEFTKTVREFGVKKGMGKLLYIYTFGFMIPAVLAEIIVQGAGGFEDGDDDEYDQYDAMSLFFGSQARTMLAMVPIVGPSVMAGFNMWNKKPYDDRISTSASISALESTVRAPNSVYEAIAEDKSWKRAIKDTLTALGMITGLPLGQLGKPIGYAADVAQGKSQPETAMDYIRGLVSGKDVNKKD